MDIDTNLYSRQLGTYGLETMEQLIQKKIYIYGMGGLGLEVAKNIILAGPKQVTINDNNLVQTRDLGSNYFINESNVGKNTRADASLFRLRELNTYVQVNVDKKNLTANISAQKTSLLGFLKEFHILVITEFITKEHAEILNQYCRENKIGFIYASINGLAGFVFVDFGDLFIIHDENGEEVKQFYVRNITKENPGIVFIDDSVDNQKLDLSLGDYVTFKEIVGMTELNDTPPRPIRILSPITFSIEDTSKFSDYICGGMIEQVKVPRPVFNKSLKDSLENLTQDDMGLNIKNCANNSNVEMLHLSFLALNEFYCKNSRFPNVNDIDDADEMIEISKIIYTMAKNKKCDWAISLNENLEELHIFFISIWSQLTPAPLCSYLGGIVAQEIIKITGKFTPFNQWYYFDFFYLLDKDHKKNIVKPQKEDFENRYFNQIAIFGKDIQEKFCDLNIFIIGCGALGTEFMKIFSLLGISSGKGKMTVTDNDIIEVSNLNRQLLFRKENVGGFKSKIACDMIKQINEEVNCIDKQIKIDELSEEILDDSFYLNQDIIFTCVDNLETRKYIDGKVTVLKNIHIDSGTLGTKAHCQIIIPNLTSNYRDKEDFEGEIALCTLHNFPSQIEHCIEWGKFKFDGYFNQYVKIFNNLITNFDEELESIKRAFGEKDMLDKIFYMNKLAENILNNKTEDFVLFAIDEFNLNFNKKIQELLIKYPIDYKNRDGSRFWLGAKRPPTTILPDLQDQSHFLFIAAFCKLISSCCKNLKLKAHENFDDVVFIKKIATSLLEEHLEKIENDKIENNLQNLKKLDIIDIKILQSEVSRLQANIEKIKSAFSNLFLKSDTKDNTLNLNKNYKENNNFSGYLVPLDFEKDNDFNQHVNFIRACANLRAQNYKIKECDFIKAKLISGRIIPAIASTTATITGFAAAQLFSICKNLKNIDLEYIKNSFINLGIGDIIFTETFPNYVYKKQYKKFKNNYVVIPEAWSVWDQIEINGEEIKTFKQLYEYFEQKYSIKLRKIVKNEKLFFEFNILNYAETDAINSDFIQMMINKKFAYSDFIKNKMNKYFIFDCVSVTHNDEKVYMPKIKYNYVYC